MICVCPREEERQSEHSPHSGTNKVVADSEQIVYILLEPRQWQGGDLTPEAFSRSELQKKKLSVARQEHSTPDELREKIVKPYLSKSPSSREVGAFLAYASEIRSIIYEDAPEDFKDRAVCVLDDGLEDHRAHSVLGLSCLSKIEGFGQRVPNYKAAVRANLAELFKKRGIVQIDSL